MDVLGEITIKQQADGSWNYAFKNIKWEGVIAHLEKMKFLIINERLANKKKEPGET